VVATGGGTFCSEENRRLIESSGGVSVYLELSWPSLLARLPGKQGERPKFGDPERARQLFLEREPLYRLARLTLAVAAGQSPQQVAQAVAQALAKLPAGRGSQ
jgi:shikimate kinase